MKLTTFIPIDNGTIKNTTIPSLMNDGSSVGIKIGYNDQSKHDFFELFSESSRSPLEQVTKNADAENLEFPRLFLEQLSTLIIQSTNLLNGKQSTEQILEAALKVNSTHDSQPGLELQDLNFDFSTQTIELDQSLENIDSKSARAENNIAIAEQIVGDENITQQAYSLLPFEIRNNPNIAAVTSSMRETIPSQQNLNFPKEKLANIEIRNATNLLADVVNQPPENKVREGIITSSILSENAKITTQTGAQSNNLLVPTINASKNDTVAMTTTATLKSPIPVVKASMSDSPSQTPILPSIVPHEISSVIGRSLTEPITQNIRANNVASQNVSNTSSIKTIELQLVPRSLGVVEVKIIKENGHLNIMMHTQTVKAENLMRLEAASIIELVKAAGLMVDEVKITIQQQPDLEFSQSRHVKSDEQSFMQGDQNSKNSSASEDEKHSAEAVDFDLKLSSKSISNAKNEALKTRDGLYF